MAEKNRGGATAPKNDNAAGADQAAEQNGAPAEHAADPVVIDLSDDPSKATNVVIVSAVGVPSRCRLGMPFSADGVAVRVTEAQFKVLQADPYLKVKLG